jgi:DNA topoisomerase I
VNAYLHEISGEEITAKDFRTNLAALALREFEHIDSDVMRKRAIVRAVEGVAKYLGNTPAVVADAISIRRFSRASWMEHCSPL